MLPISNEPINNENENIDCDTPKIFPLINSPDEDIDKEIKWIQQGIFANPYKPDEINKALGFLAIKQNKYEKINTKKAPVRIFFDENLSLMNLFINIAPKKERTPPNEMIFPKIAADTANFSRAKMGKLTEKLSTLITNNKKIEKISPSFLSL